MLLRVIASPRSRGHRSSCRSAWATPSTLAQGTATCRRLGPRARDHAPRNQGAEGRRSAWQFGNCVQDAKKQETNRVRGRPPSTSSSIISSEDAQRHCFMSWLQVQEAIKCQQRASIAVVPRSCPCRLHFPGLARHIAQRHLRNPSHLWRRLRPLQRGRQPVPSMPYRWSPRLFDLSHDDKGARSHSAAMYFYPLCSLRCGVGARGYLNG